MSTIDNVMQLAMQAQRSGDLLQAETLYMQILEEDPNHAECLGMLALVYGQQRKMDAAILCLRRAVRNKPTEPIFHYHLGHALTDAGQDAEAIEAFRMTTSLAPTQHQAFFMLGRLCMKHKRFAEAARAYEQAIDLQPGMAEAHANLGNAYRALQRHDDAIAAYEQALAIQPANAEVICNIGNIDKDQGRFDEAIARYQAALDIQPELAIAHSNLAHVLERTHQVEAARVPAERALQIDPHHVGAHRLLARLDRNAGDLQKAEARLASILNNQPRLTEPMAHASIEYGAVLDRQGRADEAFAAVLQGQQGIVPPNSPTIAQMAAFEAMLERCRTQPADDTIASWTDPTGDAPSDRLIFLLGFPRSGTTLSEQIIASHPEVLSSDESPILRAVIERIGEVSGREDYPASIEAIDDAGAAALRETYWAEAQRLVSPDVRTRRFVDKQPYNTTHMPLIRRLFPHAFFLIALRDPRDACLSLFFQDVRPNQGMLHYPDLASVVSVYSRMMACYLRYRAISGWKLHEFRYEDLVADTESVARGLLEFVDLPWNDAVLDHTKTARTKRLSTINYQEVAQPVFDRSVQRWRAYQKHFAPHQAALARFVETFGYQA